MIPVRVERAAPTIIGDQGTVTKFKVEANATAYRILSSSLYSDKPRAIIRELSTNAFDANIEAGRRHVPIEVHIPNHMNPTFKVTDSGTGMSRVTLTTVFSTYFKSTKDKSDEFNGTMGLGSKSPLSYTDSMAVTSICNGEKTMASIYLNDDGEPNINIIYHGHTDEPNGTTISLGIDENDIGRFQNAAFDVYTYFEVLPEIAGLNRYDELVELREEMAKNMKFAVEFDVSLTPKIHNISANTVEYKVGENSKIHRNNVIRGIQVVPKESGRNVVVMSNVAYPIKNEYTRGLDSAWTDYVTIYVPNGTVGFTPNREEMDYTRRTNEILEKSFTQFTKIYNRKISKEIVEAIGDIRDIKDLHEQFPHFNSTHNMFRRIDDDILLKHPNYKKLQAQLTEYYWDTVEHLHFMYRAKASTSSITGFGGKFGRNNAGHWSSAYTTWLNLMLDLREVRDHVESVGNRIHDNSIVLADTRFNKKNFYSEFNTRSISYVEDPVVFENIKRYMNKWFPFVRCVKATEVFESGEVNKNNIKTNGSNVTKPTYEYYTNSIKKLQNESTKLVPIVETTGNVLIAPDVNFRINACDLKSFTKDVMASIKIWSDDDIEVYEILGKTEYKKFRASASWDKQDNFGFLQLKDMVENATRNYVQYVRDNHTMLVRYQVMDDKYCNSSWRVKGFHPRMKSTKFNGLKWLPVMIWWCKLYELKDYEDYLKSVRMQVNVLVEKTDSVMIQELERQSRVRVANDIDNCIKEVDALVEAYQLENDDELEETEEW